MNTFDIGKHDIAEAQARIHAGAATTAAPGQSAASAASTYPRPALPVSPVLSGVRLPFSLRWRWSGARQPGILDAGQVRIVTSGRVAIALALREMGVAPGDSVLVPAYHCASMVEPVIWAGAAPVFYRIRPDTSVDLDDIATKLGPRTRVLLATNYFGFPQDLSGLRAFCDAHKLMLLEDCAHSFLGEHRGKPLGSFGDYAIASSMKFFPMYEGGCLVSARHDLSGVRLASAGAGFEAKVVLNTLEEAFSYGRLPLLATLFRLPLSLKNRMWGSIKAHRTDAPALSPGSSDGGFSFDPRWLDKRSSYCSRLLLRLVSRRRMAALRRQHYLRLAETLGALPGCRPLHASLPDGVCPWVFPLAVDAPEAVFRALKMAAVPVIRFGEYLWPGVDAGVCPISVDLSRRVLQFPCHQALRTAELDWMIVTISAVILAQEARKASTP